MANPTKVTYKLPTTNTDGSAVALSDIQSIDIGIRLKSGTAGTYAVIVKDTTITPGSDGLSTEPLSAAGILAPNTYIAAARAVNIYGNVSAWSPEFEFKIEAPTPNPPTALSVA